MKNGGLAHPFSPHRLAFFAKTSPFLFFRLTKPSLRAIILPPYGSVKASTGILKYDKRGGPSNPVKRFTLKLNADSKKKLAMAA